MSFFLRYVVLYLVGAVCLLGLSIYVGVAIENGGWLGLALAALILWLLLYLPLTFWYDYRRISRLIGNVRAGLLDEKIDPARLRESVTFTLAETSGVPEFIVTRGVDRYLTDDVAQQMAARIRTRRNKAPA